jgi:hypothetical protein
MALARDEQVIRQTVLKTTAKVRDQQIFRQVVILLGPNTSSLICFTAT